MIRSSFIISAVSAVAGVAFAVELPMDLGTLTTLDNRVYEKTKVVGSDAVGIKISHEAGSARITFDRLPRDLAAKFKVDPEAAAQQRKREEAEMLAHEKEAEAALRSQKAEPGSAPKPVAAVVDGEEDEEPVVKVEELKPAGGSSELDRIAYLQGFIRQTTAQIHEIEQDLERRERRIESIRKSMSSETGGAYRGSKANKLSYVENSARKQRDNMRRLQEMIALAKDEIWNIERRR